MAAENPTTVRKGEFAALCSVTPGRVSQWIAEGKISGAAVVGEGRAARIDVAAAMAQLAGRLDVAQRFGLNGLKTEIRSDGVALGGSAPKDLLNVKTESEQLKSALLKLRLDRERGELISRQASLDAHESVGREIGRQVDAMTAWAEEVNGVARASGVPGLTAWFRAKANEMRIAIADRLDQVARDDAHADGGVDDDADDLVDDRGRL